MKRSMAILGILVALAVPSLQGHPAARSSTKQPGAVLGATLTQWKASLGSFMPSTSADLAGWHPCHGKTGYQLLVSFQSHRASLVSGMACGNAISAKAAAAFVKLYAPADGKRHGSLADPDHGKLPLYISASLAREFPASAFQDCNGKQLPRGAYLIDIASAGDGEIDINAGGCL